LCTWIIAQTAGEGKIGRAAKPRARLTQASLVWYNALAGMNFQSIFSTRRGHAPLLSLAL